MINAMKTALAVTFILIISFSSIFITDKLVRFLRVDLTQDNLYSLSAGTRAVIRSLNSPVKITLYYSRIATLKGPEFLRKYNTYYLYICDLLREYERLSDGMIDLKFIDPRPDTDEEMEAIQYGILRYPVDEESFYLGLVVTTEFGQEKSIPFLSPSKQEILEYEISSALYAVSTRVKKKIGIISSLDVMGIVISKHMRAMMEMQGRHLPKKWHFVEQLENLYEVIPIDKDSKQIESSDILLVIHPKNLSTNVLYAIDQYIMKGGNVLFFIDPYCSVDMSNTSDCSSEINDFSKAWGFEIPKDVFVVDKAMALTIQLAESDREVPFVSYLGVRDENINRNDVTTAKLDEVRLLFPGALRLVRNEKIRAVPLLKTTSRGAVVGSAVISETLENGLNPNILLREYKEGQEQIVLAYKITGTFESAFPEGFMEIDEDGEIVKHHVHLTQAEAKSTLVVLADVDMLNDFVAFEEGNFGVNPSVDNVNFVLNIIENLSGAEVLINSRSRGKLSRSFTLLNAVETEIEKETSVQVQQREREIAKYERKLSELADIIGGEKNAIKKDEVSSEKKAIEKKLLEAKKRLLGIETEKRKKVESAITKIKIYNIVTAPAIILLLAVVMAYYRKRKRKRYREIRHEK